MPVERPTFSESWYRVVNLRPALRSTVQVFRQHYRGQMWQVLQDPGTNQFFRLNESAYQFVAMLDGRRTVGDVWAACNETLGDDAPTQGEVIQLLGQLYSSNLLQAELPPDAEGLLRRYEKRRFREVQSYLMNLMFIRIPLFDPEGFLTRWVGVFGKVFTWPAFLVWLVLLGAGLYFIVGRIDELADRAGAVLDPSNLVFLYLSFAFIKLFHEFGHAFACKKFGLATGGGEVHTMGVMLLVFTPMPYVDASSAWVLRSKWLRAFVGAGGMYVELGVAAAAAIVWANTAQGPVHAICYNMMFIASVSTLLFNGNPLLRYDGYYILSDLLEIPNLAQRSKQHLYYLVRKYVYGVRHARTPAYTKGEKFWFPLYGLASTIYRVFICTAILLFIADKFFLLGTVLAVGAVVTWVLVPLGTFLRYLFTNHELNRTRGRAMLLTGTTVVAVLAGLGLFRMPMRYKAEAVVEPKTMAVVYAEEDGFIVSVLPAGQAVQPDGPPLVVCQNPELQANLATLQAQRRELDVQRRIRRREGKTAEERYLRHRIEAMGQQIERAEKQLADLNIHAPFAGEWIVRDPERLPGMYLARGKPVGAVANLAEMRIRAIVGQNVAPALIDETGREPLPVEIRVKDRPDLEFRGRVVSFRQAGTKDLPSPALGYQAGGSIQTDVKDEKGTKAAERQFEFDIAPDSDADVRLLAGQRLVVRFTLRSRPLLVQWYLKLRQLVMKRFNI
ncbi:MAG: PqqD family peptide modification chaperone [Phycisphaerae bacterium]|nr:PqqD family peptide modification chaperone [Phycisphaerae bacterium]